MTCSREGCTRQHYAKGVCVTHYRADRRALGIDPKRSRMAIARTCECCGATFTADRAEARYCDRTCRDLANILSGQLAAASPLGVAAQPIRVRHERPSPTECKISTGLCDDCGSAWCGPYRAGRRYCSSRCQRRAMKRGQGRHHRRHARAIHERDGWRCWLCGVPTALRWTTGDPLAPTIDHIIPQAMGGTHEDDNLGTAHAICNSIRRDRIEITSLPPILSLAA